MLARTRQQPQSPECFDLKPQSPDSNQHLFYTAEYMPPSVRYARGLKESHSLLSRTAPSQNNNLHKIATDPLPLGYISPVRFGNLFVLFIYLLMYSRSRPITTITNVMCYKCMLIDAYRPEGQEPSLSFGFDQTGHHVKAIAIRLKINEIMPLVMNVWDCTQKSMFWRNADNTNFDGWGHRLEGHQLIAERRVKEALRHANRIDARVYPSVQIEVHEWLERAGAYKLVPHSAKNRHNSGCHVFHRQLVVMITLGD